VPEISQRASQVVYENPWLRLRVDDISYPDGTSGVYSVIEKGDFALVLAAERGGFWMVEQYRYPIGRRVWEFPQGTWPAGHTGPPLELAQHELREETGHTAAQWRHLGRLFTAAGFSDQAYDVFVATELTAGEPDREPTEQGMVHRWFAEADVRAMIASGQLADAHSVAALALLDGAR
jgi:8-oxo-dGTP pyrophosphatase MutT (NUDIX family)